MKKVSKVSPSEKKVKMPKEFVEADKPTPITPYLSKLIKEAEDEAKAGKCKIFYTIEEAKRYLRS